MSTFLLSFLSPHPSSTLLKGIQPQQEIRGGSTDGVGEGQLGEDRGQRAPRLMQTRKQAEWSLTIRQGAAGPTADANVEAGRVGPDQHPCKQPVSSAHQRAFSRCVRTSRPPQGPVQRCTFKMLKAVSGPLVWALNLEGGCSGCLFSSAGHPRTAAGASAQQNQGR